MDAIYQPSARRPIADGFRKTARGTVDFCLRHQVHPDVVSYLSVVASSTAAACLLFSRRWPWLLIIAPAFMYIRLWMNMLDGMVAIASGKASWRGEILNELPDRVSDVLIFAAVAHGGWCHMSLAYWAGIMALMTAYVGTMGQAVGARREFGGVMSKPRRMVMLHLAAWITFALVARDVGNRPFAHLTVFDWACVIVIVGCVQTVWVRLRSTLRLLKAKSDAQRASTAFNAAPVTINDDVTSPAAIRRQPTEHTFRAADGSELFYRAWLPEQPASKAILLFHRGHEHSGRWQETVDALGLDDVAIFAWDQRGHGRSPGDRGSAENLAVVIKDADTFARHVAATHGVPFRETVVIAHSVGAVVATAWVHDYAPPIRGLVLATPALRVKLYVPFAIHFLRLRQKFFGRGYVKSYVKAHMLTHDPAQAAAYNADPAIFRQIAVNILLDLYDTSTRLIDDAGAITTPTLMLGAGSDWVVKLSTQREFYERLSSPIKQMDVFPDMGHAIFHERGRERVTNRIRQFVNDCFNRAPATAGLLNADQGGFTRTEYDRLRGPGSAKWKLVQWQMRTFGQMSDGIRLGWDSGFDSGVTLDYVYANKPAGRMILGKIIDRNYLESIGWRGIRVRRQNLQKLLAHTIESLHRAGRPVHILDIAAGAGRYVLETIKAMPGIPASALLRDYQQVNVDAARKLAHSLGLSSVVEVAIGDAFDRASLASVATKPTIGIVSGLFELIPENDPLRRALGGLSDAIEPGGYLIYTCQPWHPQVEFIARCLTNREGNPWIMRRRTQREMDELVEAAGFEKLDQLIDQWGIFTVALARKK